MLIFLGHASFKIKINLLFFVLKKYFLKYLYTYRKLQNECKDSCCTLHPDSPNGDTLHSCVQHQNQEIDISTWHLLTRLQTLFGFHHFLTCIHVCVWLSAVYSMY